MFFAPCTKKELLKIIAGLPSKTSSGYDNVSNTLLKEIGEELLEPLISHVQSIPITGKIPNKYETG